MEQKIKNKEELKKQIDTLLDEYNQVFKDELQNELQPLRDKIDKILGDKYKCGILVNKENIHAILDKIMSPGQSVFIKYEIYKI